jgi:N-acetylmuramoyl-L-alanine amidase
MPTVGNDIGHGSNTYENTGGKAVSINGKVYEEHDFNCRVGIALSRHLKRHGIGEKKIQQANCPEVSLTTRTNYYNAQNVDVVVSNHANANSKKEVKGVCVFAWHNHPESQRLQKYLVEEYKKMGFETHGHGEHESELGNWTDLHIVRSTKMTAVLIENGFMTNPDDQKKIFFDMSYAEKCAEAQAKALCKFFNIPYEEEVQVSSVSKAIEEDSADGKLTRGEKGSNVKLLNQMLNTLEYTRKTDDIFDQYTEAALKAFQKDHGLKQDAIYTSAVGKVMIEAIALKKERIQAVKLPEKNEEMYRLAKLVDTKNKELVKKMQEAGYVVIDTPEK